jgi:hypothetical protein
MDARIRVFEGLAVDPDRDIVIERGSDDRCRLSLVDYFLSPGGSPFLSVEFESATLVMTLGGACTAVKTDDACFALIPVGSEMRVTFQAEDWPYPEQWNTPREEFNEAVLALL